jgi:hypothetical protein
MTREPSEDFASEPRRFRGPQGLGEQAARALEQGVGAGSGIGAMEEESILQRWAEESGCLISSLDWEGMKIISKQTSEHEVRYRLDEHRAWKRTWPGMFGFVPKRDASGWMPKPASPREYLLRQTLQNELFGDSIRLEGAMIDTGPSMIIGRSSGGLSLVVSQPWLDASNPSEPHPTDRQIFEYLTERGFEPLFGSFFGWQAKELGLVVLDAKNDNFVATDLGIFPIDLQIAEIQVAA